MKKMRTRLLSLLLVLVTVLSLLPTSALAASSTGTGIKPTSNTNYWTTRLLHDGTPYSYKPPMAAGKMLYCIKIDERRMEIMLRQMRTGTNYVWLRGDVVSYGDRRIDSRLLEALDVMLELTRVQPGFYSKDGLHEPFLLRFTGNGKGAGYLFSVAWLDAATHIATVPRMKGERIIWISEIGSFGEIDLPRHHFFAARQENGTHRFFGSNEPEKI